MSSSTPAPIPEGESLIFTYPILKVPVASTPLFDVSKIRLEPLFDVGDEEPVCKFKGYVKLVDYDGKEFCMFTPGAYNYIKIPLVGGSQKSATLQKSNLSHPLPLLYFNKLKISLTDTLRADKPVCVDSNLLDLVQPTQLAYDEEQKLVFNSEYWRITLYYALFRCGVIPLVDVEVLKKKESGSTTCDGRKEDPCFVNVKGTISASTKMADSNVVSCILYDETSKAENWNISVPTHLPAMAVLAYSMFNLEVDLTVDGQKFSSGGAFEFEPNGQNRQYPFFENIVGEKWLVQLSVTWATAFDFLEEDESYELKRVVKPWKRSRKGKEPSMSLMSMLEVPWIRDLMLENKDPRDCVELYSVSFGSFDSSCSGDGALHICGTIVCTDADNEDVIFNVSDMNPVKVYPHKPLSLEFRRCWRAEYFDMKFDLKDGEGGEICKGYLHWGPGAFQVYDRRTCSVVWGKVVFAVVHYTIFENAWNVKLEAILSVNGKATCEVYGTMFATCSCYEYRTPYGNEYYRSVLFSKKSEPVTLSFCDDAVGSNVPLSKCVVAVPFDTALVVSVDLSILVGNEYKKIQGEVTFYPGAIKTKKGTYCPGDVVERKLDGANCGLKLKLTYV